MYENKKIAVIIAAAGKGTRVGGPVPKQYLKIGGEPVILKTLKAFAALDEVDHIFIVTNEEYMDRCQEIVRDNGLDKVKGIVKGGAERQESVYNALQEVNRICPGVSYVLIHDAARPFVSEQVVRNVIKATAEKRCCRSLCCYEKQYPPYEWSGKPGSGSFRVLLSTDAAGFSQS